MFKDWDGNMMNNAKQPATFCGWDEIGCVYAKADGLDFESILDSDSAYVRNLRLSLFAKATSLIVEVR